MGFIVPIIVKLISTEAVKTLIALGLRKLLDSKTDGVTKDISEAMIDAIAKSKANPTTADVFRDAMLTLKQG